jgi:hypothetical protein
LLTSDNRLPWCNTVEVRGGGGLMVVIDVASRPVASVQPLRRRGRCYAHKKHLRDEFSPLNVGACNAGQRAI